jgi:hypothetical protein
LVDVTEAGYVAVSHQVIVIATAIMKLPWIDLEDCCRVTLHCQCKPAVVD